ncbi:MAG: PQQ-binding-like beta-propeller repeat protein [Planctomycetaceae bacterium]
MLRNHSSDRFDAEVSAWSASNRHVLTGLLIALLVIHGGIVFAGPDNSDLATALHGPLEHLQQSLVQSTQDARLIAVADRDLRLGESARAFQSLRFVFAHGHDAFTPISPGRPSVSSYQAALHILKSANVRDLEAWTADSEPLAIAALTQATGSSRQLEEVARHFPYTAAGLHAYAATIVLAESRGQRLLSAALLAELNSMYADTVVSFDARTVLQGLRGRLGKDVGLSHQSYVAGEAVSIPGPAADDNELPWPEPVWTWQESVWRFPQGVNLFAGLTAPEQRSALTLNSWQPALTRDAVILRTPFRVVALSRESGALLWSLPTDTTGKPPSLRDAGINALLARPTTADEVLQMDDLGTVSASDRFVFFVDRFRKYAESGRPSRSHLQFGQRLRNLPESMDIDVSPDGTRLVAITLQPEPRVAWTIGDAEEFPYRFDSATQPPPAQQQAFADEPPAGQPSEPPAAAPDGDAANPEQPSSPFAGQHFCGVPLVYDQMLFVLSSDDETVWLNCLTEATGRLLWQRPMTYLNDTQISIRGRMMMPTEPVPGASLCGTDGDTVVCALNSGVVIGVRLTDGQLQWATNVRAEPPTLTMDDRSIFSVPVSPVRGISFRPVLHNGRMIWAAPQSTHIHCLDVRSGSILWKVAAVAQGPGRLEGSHDHYAVTVTDRQVVLIGDRHVRALDAATGGQIWAVNIPAQTGRATCCGSVCLVPLHDGTLASVNLKSGTANVVSQAAFAQQAPSVVGALVADQDFVCLATPLSVTMFPAASKIQSGMAADRDPRANNPAGTDASPTLIRARIAILASRLNEGVRLLSDLVQYGETNPSTDVLPVRQSDIHAAQQLLTDVLLRCLALHRFPEGRSEDSDLPSQNVAVQHLQHLPLNNEQQLRLAVLAQTPQTLSSTDGIATDRLPMLDLLPHWKSRTDVAAWSSLSPHAAESLVSFRDGDRSLLSRAEHAILFPQHVGPPADQLAFAELLRDSHYPTAAELFALTVIAEATDDQQRPFREFLNRLRGTAASVDQTALPAPLASAFDPETFEVRETLHLHNDSRIAELLRARYLPLETPEWYRHRLMVGHRDLFQVNMETGAVSIPIRLPAVPQDADLRRSFHAPGLLPLQGSDHVGMTSLVASGGPSLLWWKRMEREPADFSPFESGPVGSSYMIVASRQMLHCLHPLTGELLWKRHLESDEQQPLFGERRLRLAGDDQVIGVFGENLKSCEIFQTKNGERRDVVALDVPDDCAPVVSGRRILYPCEQVLKLIDLKDGTDLLADKPALKVASGGDARLIRNDRVVTVTEDFDVVVLNLLTGNVELRSSVAEQMPDPVVIGQPVVTGLPAFERDGRLFVLLKNWNRHAGPRSSAAPLGDTSLGAGTLFCLDSKTGQQLWHHNTLPATMPVIYGDPTNLLVKWAWHNPERSRETPFGGMARTDEDDEQSLVLTVLDATTGKVMIEQPHLGKAIPLRCHHDARRKRLTLETESSLIEVRYGER